MKSNRATQFVFGSLTVLFFALALGDLTLIKEVTVTAGYIGLVCGASAIYTGLALGQRGQWPDGPTAGRTEMIGQISSFPFSRTGGDASLYSRLR